MAYTVATLAITFLVARLLPPAEAGTVLVALSLTTGLAVVAELGLRRIANRFIAASLVEGAYGRTRAVIWRVLAIGTVSAVVLSAGIASPAGEWVLGQIFPSTELAKVAVLVGLLVGVRAISALRAEIFRGFQDFRSASIFDRVDGMVLTAGVVAGGALLMPDAINMRTMLVVAVLAWVPGICIGGWMLWRRIRALSGDGSATVAQLLTRSWPLWLQESGTLLMSQSDLWIVGALLGATDAAAYGVALRLLGLISFILVIGNAVLPPLLAELYTKEQYTRLEVLVRTTATIAAIPAVGVVGVLIVAGRPLLSTIFGDFYASAWPLVAILCVGQLINVWVGYASVTLIMAGRERGVMVVSLVSSAIMVGLAFLGAYVAGVVGVAIGSAVGLAIKHIWMWNMARVTLGVRTDVRFVGVEEMTAEINRLRAWRTRNSPQ